jgi:hypothetical protein
MCGCRSAPPPRRRPMSPNKVQATLWLSWRRDERRLFSFRREVWPAPNGGRGPRAVHGPLRRARLILDSAKPAADRAGEVNLGADHGLLSGFPHVVFFRRAKRILRAHAMETV